MKTTVNEIMMNSRWTSGLRIAAIALTLLVGFGGSALAQGNREAQSWHFTAIQGSDARGCYWDITYWWTCVDDGQSNPKVWSLPHGIRITFTGATISVPAPTFSAPGWAIPSPASTPNTIAWWLASTQSTNVEHTCSGVQSFDSHILPTGTSLSPSATIRIYVSPSTGGTLVAEPLRGEPSATAATVASDHSTTFQFQVPTASTNVSETCICSGSATVVSLVPPVPAPTTILWYKAPATCDGPCPSMPTTVPPGGPWTLVNANAVATVGANECPTHTLNSSFCYIALLQNACFSYYSTIEHVKVSEPLSGPIVVNGPTGTPIHNVNHVCISWHGSLSFNPASCCLKNPSNPVTWTESIDDAAATIVTAAYVSNLTLDPPASPKCCTKYTFIASAENTCGPYSTSFTIVVDREITAADVTLGGSVWSDPVTPPTAGSPLGPICDSQSAIVGAEPVCSGAPCEGINILEWQVSNWTDLGVQPTNWTTLAGSHGTPFYTNRLANLDKDCNIKSIWYRVGIQNGACPEIYSNPYEIQVKPRLSVDINYKPSCLPVQLSATKCYEGLTYTWYHDGQPVGGPLATYNATVAGYYYVVATDGACHVSAKSKAILLCGPPIVKIAGPCGTCDHEKFKLEAIVACAEEGCCKNCTYLWSVSPDQGQIQSPTTGATITAVGAGTYSVTVTCPPCSTTVTHQVDSCPPPTSCKCKGWESEWFTLNGPVKSDLRITPSPRKIKCDGKVEVKDGNYIFGIPIYTCSGNCTATYKWSVIDVASGTTINSGTITGTPYWFPVTFTPGSYEIKIWAYCGGTVPCDSCVVYVNDISPCKCGPWESSPITLTLHTDVLTKPVSIKCGGNTIIDGGIYTIIPNFQCSAPAPACTPIYNWSISGGTSSNGSDATIPNFLFVNGLYTVTIVPVCGGKPCDTCKFWLRVKPWERLISPGVLTGEADPVNVGLSAARARLASSPIGKQVETWYKGLLDHDAISIMLSKHLQQLKSLFKIARKMITEGGTLTKGDVDVIESVMKMMNSDIAPAPAGTVDTSLRRLRSSVNMKWPQVIENLIKE